METNSVLFHVQAILKRKNLLTTKLLLMPRMLLKNSVMTRSQLQQIISPTSLVKVVLVRYTREIFQMVLRWLLRCYQTHHNKDHKNFLMRYVFHLFPFRCNSFVSVKTYEMIHIFYGLKVLVFLLNPKSARAYLREPTLHLPCLTHTRNVFLFSRALN